MEKKLIKGTDALAEAAVRAGCRFFSGYPITPQNEILDYFAWRLPEVGGVFIQAESEVSAANMIYGAAGTGVRALTSSSSPGFSLKQEAISYMAGAELPCVVVNVMRAGPGLGGIQPGQADYFQATKGGGHGDYRLIVYAPSSVQEICDLVPLAFEKADEYLMPVLILADGLLAQMMEPVTFADPIDYKPKKPWATVGWEDKSRPKALINSLQLQAELLEEVNLRLQEKYARVVANEKLYSCDVEQEADLLVVSYGSMSRVVQSAADLLKDKVKINVFRPITLWPFPDDALRQAASKAKSVGVVEMSSGQMVEDVERILAGQKKIQFYGRMGGIVPDHEEVAEELLKMIKEAGK